MTFTLRNKAGVYSLNSCSLSSPLGALDPNYLQLPQNDISDNQVIFAGVSGGLTYRLSLLLSLNIGAAGTLVRRQSSALYGPKWTAFLSHGWDDSRRFFCIFSNFLAVDDQ